MKRIFGFLFFTTLMLVKVSAFHVHTHHDDDCNAIENCEICDIVFESQSSDFEIISHYIPHTSENSIQAKPFTEKAQIFSGEAKVYRLFSRPPPSI
nr:hypothetical protein [Allomuricauda sp.]